MFIVIEPFFKHGDYLYEMYSYGGHNLKEQCKKRATNGNDWSEAELLTMYKRLV